MCSAVPRDAVDHVHLDQKRLVVDANGAFANLPTYSAACDQVDCVKYLIALLMRVLPSTSNTSPGCSVDASWLGGEVVNGL